MSQATVSPSTAPVSGPLRILHLEDSEADHELVLIQLRRAGLMARCTRVETEAQFLQALPEGWDVILSDYTLPGYSGLLALEALQATGAVMPFVIVSGVIGEDTAVEAMRRGASDYLLKDKLARLGPAIERAIAAAAEQRARLRAEQELARSRELLSELAQHLQSSVEAERAAIARELHDDVGGSLTALKFDLAWIVRNALQEPVADRARQALSVLDHAMGANQRLMLNLRPAVLDQGLVPALQWHVRTFGERAGIACQLRAPEPPPEIDPDISLVAYRTVQEALTNVSKHAQARRVQVDLAVTQGILSIEIADDGCGWSGADLAKPGSFGLRGLQERARTVGGWIDLSSTAAGSSVILSIPLGGEIQDNETDGEART